MNDVIEQLTLPEASNVLAALKRMESSRFQIVFVLDEAGHLLGLITNGGLRRHMLAGGVPPIP